MSLQTFQIIANIQTVLNLLGLIIFFRIRHPKTIIRLVALIILASVVAQLGSIVLREFKLANPNYAGTFYELIQFFLLTIIYAVAVGEKKYRTIFSVIVVSFLVYGFLNLIFFQKDSINSNTFIVESLLTILYTLFYFSWLLRKLPTTDLQRFPMFWINSAWIIFSSGNLFLFAFTSYLVNVLNNDLILYWSLHNILAIIKSGMIVYALWMDLQNTKSPS